MVERVGGTLYQEILKRSWNIFDLEYYVLQYQGYNLTYIVYRKYFRVDRNSIFIRSSCPKRKWLILWIPFTSKRKAYFSPL